MVPPRAPGRPALGGRRRDSRSGDRSPGRRHVRQRVLATWPGRPGPGPGRNPDLHLARGGGRVAASPPPLPGRRARDHPGHDPVGGRGKRACDLSGADRGVLHRGAREEAGRRDRLAGHRLRRLRVALAGRPARPPLRRVRTRAGGGADLPAGRRRTDPQPGPAGRRTGAEPGGRAPPACQRGTHEDGAGPARCRRAQHLGHQRPGEYGPAPDGPPARARPLGADDRSTR